MRHPLASTALLVLAGLSTAAAAQTLPRRASLGIAMASGANAPEGPPLVDRVLPGQTAERLGLRQGDRIVAAGGKPVARSQDVVAYASGLIAGDPVELRVDRGGKAVRLRGKALGRPTESFAGGETVYGTVPFRGGQLRDILVTPNGVANPPVVYLIQGFTCTTVESPADGPYHRLGEELIRRGIAYYRVEKPGVGDSAGGPRCVDTGYEVELDAFRAAYRKLAESFGQDRIFMLGHSLGGLEAPMLAAEQPPRGVAVYGTVLRNWADYHHDVDVYQAYLLTGADPAAEADRAERNRRRLEAFYLERRAPADIIRDDPAAAQALRDVLAWDGGERVFGRHYSFAQDLPHQPLIKAWRDARTNVLALYGESDVVALFDSDHRMIADIADFHRPGTGRYVEIAGTDHGMTLVGNRSELRAKAIAAGSPPDGEFNPRIAEVLAD
ncbi:alpha/beta fold hydrolase [Sphingomonas parva]|uniref:Alpha/beta fold hydrolase n=1 Tax=Sphingomonas parva TaxID=2555898 RepID=A0A4Y8ZLZ1_9SPHN|nr:alpha/beta fold hydrolase [Sphingomonas parva]TFI57018.1 alpha/beta fold hydrolase [Sphingomonas parva]